MQELIKRYFWVVGAITVMVCAVFAAKATSHVIEAKVLSDPEHPPRIPPPPPRHDAPKPTRNKDGAQLASRNMFCSECTPEVAVPTDPSQIAVTSLPLQLLATNIGPTDAQSWATVVNTSTEAQGAYSVGDKLPGASGPVTAIHYKFVEFQNGNRIERVMLVGGSPPPVSKPKVVQRTSRRPKDEMQAAIEAGIKKIDDHTFEIDKSLVDKVIANPMAFTKGARVVPAMKNGKPEGIKLYAIRPTSPYAKLGLSNGDTLMSINGFQLNSLEKGLEIYGKLREATSLEVDIQRRGKPMTIRYTIR